MEFAEAYLGRFGASAVRDRKLLELMHGLRPPARVLDLGCGAGLPVSRELFGRGFQVTGVDGSACQIARARQNVSQTRFIHADMTSISFPSAYFEAIGAFYSITHVPRDEHAMLLGHIANWLSAGGRFVGSFGASAVEGWTGEWLGTTMFISCFDIDTTKRLVADAGLTIESAEIRKQDNENARFLWITARKP